MKITIHRGANQIGGCITEISTDKAKIFIDFGSNLPGTESKELTAGEVANKTADADAIFYSHYHGDHVGLHHLVPGRVTQYMGAGAIDVMRCKYEALNVHQDFSQQLAATERMIPFKERERIEVKDGFFITPYFVSHSAFDAYMFLIECGGKRILHTGDFRCHGYLGKGLFPTLEKYIGKVDLLITEGTMLGRKQEQVVTEHKIQLNTISLLHEHKHKYVFALCSSTDIDRLASFHAACKATKRAFLVDSYQRKVLNVFSEYSGRKSPLFDFDHIFELRGHKAYRIEKIANYLRDKGFLMPVRMNSLRLIKDMMQVFTDEEPWLIYSMWDGYAEENGKNAIESVIAIRHLFDGHISDGVKDGFHTSGHANVDTLYEVCNSVRPSIGARTRFIRYDGIDEKVGAEMNVIKDVTFEGTILNQVRKTIEFLETQVAEHTFLGQHGQFVTLRDYPKFVIQEMTVNACCHRAYNIKGTEIQIKMFDNRLVFESPGKLPGQVKPINIRNTHFSRNPKIATFLKAYHYVKEFGEGIDRICREQEANGAEIPTFRTDEFILKVTVPKVTENTKKVTEKLTESPLRVTEKLTEESEKLTEKAKREGCKLTENRIAILKLMMENPYISRAELSTFVGISENSISRNIEAMRGKLLRRVGPDKGGFWEIIE